MPAHHLPNRPSLPFGHNLGRATSRRPGKVINPRSSGPAIPRNMLDYSDEALEILENFRRLVNHTAAPDEYQPPPPNTVPGPPGTPYRQSGGSNYGEQSYDDYDTADVYPQSSPGSIFMIRSLPTGGVIINSYLTRRGIIVLIIILFLIFLGLLHFPGLWEIVFALM